ncbi:MAG: hypothetical protein KDA86_26385 [Planctomycetaceae bacterium]|nr:hypothetical protein [Planctomycetaceae bacterium]
MGCVVSKLSDASDVFGEIPLIFSHIRGYNWRDGNQRCRGLWVVDANLNALIAKKHVRYQDPIAGWKFSINRRFPPPLSIRALVDDHVDGGTAGMAIVAEHDWLAVLDIVVDRRLKHFASIIESDNDNYIVI